MAIPAQGLVFTWGDTPLQEIQALEVNALQERLEFGGLRSSLFYVGGQLRLTGFSTVGLPASDIGRWRQMRITVPVNPSQVLVLWDDWAKLDSVTSRGTTNGAMIFAFLFTLWSLDGNDAGTAQSA
jgi:hypothetical protein